MLEVNARDRARSLDALRRSRAQASLHGPPAHLAHDGLLGVQVLEVVRYAARRRVLLELRVLLPVLVREPLDRQAPSLEGFASLARDEEHASLEEALVERFEHAALDQLRELPTQC